MADWANQMNEVWQYAILFLFALAPWIDVFFVVPLGVAWGLSPAAVGMVGFAGNFLTIILIVFFFRKIAEWRERRRMAKGRTTPSKRETRARQIWERYGLPALALIAPVAVGTDIAAVLALSVGSPRTRVVVWMAVSLALWSAAMAVGAAYGFAYMKWI